MFLSLKTALRLAALIAAAAASAGGAIVAADWIAARNRSELRAALDSAGHGWALVETDGLIARIGGAAPDEMARFAALKVAGNVVNPTQIRDAMTVAEAAPLPLPDYRLEILRARNRVTLLGLIPAATMPAGGLGLRFNALAPGAEVTDLTIPSPEAVPAGWPTSLDPVLDAMADLKDARLVLVPGRVEIAGMAPERDTAARIYAALAADLDPGTAIGLKLAPPRPVLSPFVLRLRADAEGVRFDACAAATEAGRDRILAAAMAAGASGADAADCTLAFGAPGPEWEDVAEAAIAALGRMGAGTVTLSDLTVTLAPGETVSGGLLAAAADAIEAALPPAYGLRLVDPASDAAKDATAPPAPAMVFTASRAPDAAPRLEGPVGSAAPVVESFTRARFPGPAADLALETRRPVGPDWPLRVLAGLDALSMVAEGRLTVTPDLVRLTGESGDPQAGIRITSALAGALGDSAAAQVDIAYDAGLDPNAALPAPETCLARIGAIQDEAKITFAPGATELDAEAQKIVRRIALVLRRCGFIAVEIGGHTDSRGRDSMNRELSQQRAAAVRTALIAAGVPAETLTATGHGEDRPIADNGDAAGREANRRIEFSLRDPLQGPPAPGTGEDGAGQSGLGEAADGPD